MTEHAAGVRGSPERLRNLGSHLRLGAIPNSSLMIPTPPYHPHPRIVKTALETLVADGRRLNCPGSVVLFLISEALLKCEALLAPDCRREIAEPSRLFGS